MQPLITVITVVRNAASCLEGTVISVLSQTYPNLEYIVVDGASADGTVDVIRSFDAKISRWISEPDDGIADGFNKGIKLASGEAMLFMNAGDEFVGADSLKTLIERVPDGTNLKGCIVYGDAIIAFPTGERRQSTDHRKLTSSKESPICHQSALIGGTIQRQFQYDPRLRMKMDLDLWLRCSAAGVPFLKIPMAVCRYLPGGVTSRREDAVRATIEGGLVRLINRRRDLTVRSVIRLLFDAIEAYIKGKLHILAGVRVYSAVKRVIGRPVLETH